MLMLVFQVLLWIVIEIFILTLIVGWLINSTERISDGLIVLGIWLSLFTVAGLFMVYALLWQIAGIEKVKISGYSMEICRMLFGVKRKKEYSSEYIKDLRVSTISRSEIFGWSSFLGSLGLTGGMIGFDYGAKTFKFGSGIDEAEAKMIIAEIQKKYPQYKS